MTNVDTEPAVAAIEHLRFISASPGPDGVHAWPLEETYAALIGIARHVPITRVTDLTPLHRLGIPAWTAVTTLARDLTVHAGKGATRLAAKVSAMMEAVDLAARLPPLE